MEKGDKIRVFDYAGQVGDCRIVTLDRLQPDQCGIGADEEAWVGHTADGRELNVICDQHAQALD